MLCVLHIYYFVYCVLYCIVFYFIALNSFVLKTVRTWLKSEKCEFGFCVAHDLASVKKQTRLLLILKEEIPKIKLFGCLKFYIKTIKYLDSAHQL